MCVPHVTSTQSSSSQEASLSAAGVGQQRTILSQTLVYSLLQFYVLILSLDITVVGFMKMTTYVSYIAWKGPQVIKMFIQFKWYVVC